MLVLELPQPQRRTYNAAGALFDAGGTAFFELAEPHGPLKLMSFPGIKFMACRLHGDGAGRMEDKECMTHPSKVALVAGGRAYERLWALV